MKEKRVTSTELPAAKENIEQALQFFRQRLNDEDISKEIVMETMLVIEALFHNLLAQGIDRKTILRLSCHKNLGNVVIQIRYKGKMAYLFSEEEDEITPENHILRAYEDKLDSSYNSGVNTFQITVKRKHLRSLLYCGIGILCAFLAYQPIRSFMSEADQLKLVVNYLQPIQQLFGNAAFMIGAPVTFLSLLRNLTNTYILSERDSIVRRLGTKAVATSVITILMAIFMGFLLLSRFQAEGIYVERESTGGLTELIAGIIPPSIFEPFETVSPVPLIVLALINTYAFCSSGKHFMQLKQTVDVCYTVFSSMIGLVLYAFPFIFFVMFLELVIINDLDILQLLLQGTLLILAGSTSLILFYLIRLKIGGVKIRPFLKKIPPLLMENCRINSAIDAVPFNIRYCVRNYGMNRKRLERMLPILAQIMFDGNCYLMMSVALFIAFCLGVNLTWFTLLMTALLIFFLSLGAPNQPGGMLIGTMIVLKYFGLNDTKYTFIAIFIEAALGIVQNLINTIGDIVTASIEEQTAS
ncbi:MAG: cation:dicarboxylase symporter family transporter [Lachnospiraceae bacterium]|nr:cation:dicarboxylase symporter family transporter [Lachnospiraceae bacterium]